MLDKRKVKRVHNGHLWVLLEPKGPDMLDEHRAGQPRLSTKGTANA